MPARRNCRHRSSFCALSLAGRVRLGPTCPAQPGQARVAAGRPFALLTERRADDHRVLPVLLSGGARPSRVSRERSARM